MNSIVLNKVYKFDLTGSFSFGNIPIAKLAELFQNGSTVSSPMEEQLVHWFPELTRVYGCDDHDHVDTTGVKYDAKNFTKYGLKFMPSNQMGTGRKFNESVAHKKAKELIYICCDVVDFPIIRVKFAKGSEMIKDYPKCKITKKKREEFFNDKSC